MTLSLRQCNDTPLSASIGHTFHPDLYFASSNEGTSVFASKPLETNTRLVSCPYDQAVTPDECRRSLSSLCPYVDSLSDRQTTAAVLALHKCSAEARQVLLQHGFIFRWAVYVDSLPEEILTPLFYTEEELGLLQHTNLHGATMDRQREWQQDYQSLILQLSSLPSAGSILPWNRYLWSCCMISSRAFPSSLISGDSATSVPVLFPGVDSLNHSPTAKILWLKESDRLTLITEQPINEQVYNNYGPKSNEELLLGYGFVLPNNPADLVALKLGKPRVPPNSTSAPIDYTSIFQRLGIDSDRHIITRDGGIPEGLLGQMRLYLADDEERDIIQDRLAASNIMEEVLGFISWDNELGMLEQLGNMLEMKFRGVAAANESDGLSQSQSKRSRAEDGKAVAVHQDGIRPEVRRMIEIYRTGQSEILETALQQHAILMQDTLANAEASGEIDIEME